MASSSALVSQRHDEIIGSSIAEETGGNVVVGPYAHDVDVVRMGALIETTLSANAVSVTSSPDVGAWSIPASAVADDVVLAPAYADPAAADGEQKGKYTLPAGNTLTVTGAAGGGSSGDYRLFVQVIHKPLAKGDARVTEVAVS